MPFVSQDDFTGPEIARSSDSERILVSASRGVPGILTKYPIEQRILVPGEQGRNARV